MFVEIANVMYVISVVLAYVLVLKQTAKIEVILEETQVREVFNTKWLYLSIVFFVVSAVWVGFREYAGVSILSLEPHTIISIQHIFYYIPYFLFHISGLWVLLVNRKFLKEEFHPPLMNLSFMFLGFISVVHFVYCIYRFAASLIA